MKDIRLIELRLVNFKGMREFRAVFDGKDATVCGRNATGKSTLADAYAWVLFDTDSRGSARFDIKTLGGDGTPLLHLPHEVSATISVDGEKITLCRKYKEKWSGAYGKEILMGHEEERVYNGVPMTRGEYDARIAGICGADMLALLTRPTAFFERKPDEQRAILMRMAGSPALEDVTGKHPGLSGVADVLGGMTEEEALRRVNGEIKSMRAALDGTNARIEERMLDASGDGDGVDALAEECERLQGELSETRGSGCSRAAARRLREAEEERDAARDKVARKAQADAAGRAAEVSLLRAEAKRYKTFVSAAEADAAAIDKETASLAVETREAEEALCAAEAEEMTVSDGDFTCPMCGRALEMNDIERKITRMEETFNLRKAESVKAAREKKTSCAERLARLKERQDGLLKDVARAHDELAALTKRAEALAEAAPADIDALCASDAAWKEADEKVRTLSAGRGRRDAGKRAEKIREALAEARKRLAARMAAERSAERVEALKRQCADTAAAIAVARGKADLIRAFRSAKAEEESARIDALFKITRFKLLDMQADGTAKECCTATADGVPYASQNTAMRMNMALDVVNALSRYAGVAAPIFIDNAECVNEYVGGASQRIFLRVTDDNSLVIK